MRGFLVAGARRVVVSNWKVNDRSTRELMVSFYRQLIEQGKGHAEALRAAKLQMLKRPETSHPYHWAPFVLWGPWN